MTNVRTMRQSGRFVKLSASVLVALCLLISPSHFEQSAKAYADPSYPSITSATNEDDGNETSHGDANPEYKSALNANGLSAIADEKSDGSETASPNAHDAEADKQYDAKDLSSNSEGTDAWFFCLERGRRLPALLFEQ